MKLPTILVEGETLPEVWENSLLELWKKGFNIKTEYDKPEDPPSKDCTMLMVVNSPMEEPRIHMGLPSRYEDLAKYVMEVVDGIHDNWIDPEAGKWTYTYHERLTGYSVQTRKINQIELAIDKLSKVPYTRRAQAITWKPDFDPKTNDPPCLQRIWLRILEGEDKNSYLIMETSWRSRDAFKAAFMNMYAMTELQKKISEELSEKMGKRVLVGPYLDFSNSYHIYGSYFSDFEKFLNLVRTREFYNSQITRSRTIRSDSPIVQAAFKRAREEVKLEKTTGKKGIMF
ncbi:MAG: thymidylate synthase [Candidatus Aenigmatarchaeota archaeon]